VNTAPCIDFPGDALRDLTHLRESKDIQIPWPAVIERTARRRSDRARSGRGARRVRLLVAARGRDGARLVVAVGGDCEQRRGQANGIPAAPENDALHVVVHKGACRAVERLLESRGTVVKIFGAGRFQMRRYRRRSP